MKKTCKRSSEILVEIAQNEQLKGDVTYETLVKALGDRAFGVAILFFALPALLPLSAIPGIALIFSAPIMVFALQMIGKRPFLWLPKSIGMKTIPHTTVVKMIHVAVPILKVLERFTKPRWVWMTGPLMEILNGLMILCLALLLMLPIPLSNFIFGGMILLFSLGTTEKDGLFVTLGYIFLGLYFLFMYKLILFGFQEFG